ncbi:unknown [Ruminococcus sp. CAG:382]|nr:unknown [Ruminococcus sp. CAG:382]
MPRGRKHCAFKGNLVTASLISKILSALRAVPVFDIAGYGAGGLHGFGFDKIVSAYFTIPIDIIQPGKGKIYPPYQIYSVLHVNKPVVIEVLVSVIYHRIKTCV